MLSGAMDILVIRDPNGTYRSSSFHVRFGSLRIVRSKKRTVEIYVNGKKKGLTMTLHGSGDAYFPFDHKDDYMIKQSSLIADREFSCRECGMLLEERIKGQGEKISKDKNLLETKYKSFFPSSNQIELLELEDGPNEIYFVCRDAPGGIQVLRSKIYLWPSSVKLVISDVDGTITKSDVLGQVLPALGKDWSHDGVTGLFTSIDKNGYKLIYLTARAIGQSLVTKRYLDNLTQDRKKLPPAPMLMSPDGIFTSLKREVIEKKPHLLKIPLLTEIKNLFPEGTKPYYAGFGNRETDAIAYRYLDIPMDKIFIIDTSSRVIQLGKSEYTSYRNIDLKVEEDFPKIEEEEDKKNEE